MGTVERLFLKIKYIECFFILKNKVHQVLNLLNPLCTFIKILGNCSDNKRLSFYIVNQICIFSNLVN